MVCSASCVSLGGWYTQHTQNQLHINSVEIVLGLIWVWLLLGFEITCDWTHIGALKSGWDPLFLMGSVSVSLGYYDNVNDSSS